MNLYSSFSWCLKPKNKQKLLYLFSIVLLVVSLKHSFDLRSISYSNIPENYLILDERTWVWQGLSLRKTGIPTGWSDLPAYTKNSKLGVVDGLNISINQEKPNINSYGGFPKPLLAISQIDVGYGVTHIRFVQPLIEQPPLGGVLFSSMVSDDTKNFIEVKPEEFRRISLYLALITSILIFIVGVQIFNNPSIALMGSVIYGSAPSYLLLSRYALLENILSPFLLIVVALLVFSYRLITDIKIFEKHSKIILLRILLFLAGVTTGLATLIKITGWPILIMSIILLWYWKFGFKNILIYVLPALFLGSLYFVWVLYLDSNLFLNILFYQGAERGFIGSINFLLTLIKVNILNFPLDGWWIGGFLVFILLPFKKEYIPLFGATLTVLFTVLLLGGATYPWYFIPMIPFMALASAFFIWRMIMNPSFSSILVFYLIFFSSSFYWGFVVEQESKQLSYLVYRIVSVVFIISGIAWSVSPRIIKYRKTWIILMIVLMVAILRLNDKSFYFILTNWGDLPYSTNINLK